MSYKRILVGSEGSPASLEAVRYAAGLAKATKARLTIVCAFSKPDQSLIKAIWDAGRLKEAERVPEEIEWRITPTRLAEAAVEESQKVAAEEGVEARSHLAEGEAAEVLIKTAEDMRADLLVVGDRRSTTTSRFLLGSTPHRVSHYSPCDLLIVYSDQE